MAIEKGGGNSPVNHAKISSRNRNVFPRLDAHFSILLPSAEAEVRRSQRKVSPIFRRPVIRVTEDHSFHGCVRELRDHESRLPNSSACRDGRIRKIKKWNAEETEVGIQQGDRTIDMQRGMRTKKFPVRIVRFANGQPCMLDLIRIRIDACYFFRFKNQRIWRNENIGIRPVLHHHFAVHLLEMAHPADHIEVAGFRFQMLSVHIEQDIALGRGEISFGVVLNMVGVETKIFILDFNIAIGEIEIALLALLLGLEPHTCFGGGRWRLNFLGNRCAHRKNRRGQRQENAPTSCDNEFATEFHDSVPPADLTKGRKKCLLGLQ